MKRWIAFCCILVLAAALSGCGMFSKEFTVITEYAPNPVQEQDVSEKITVKNYSALKQALTGLVTEGESSSTVVFDSAYDGNPAVDMAGACWQVRTENAICVYCVENISYELNTIVTHTEAAVTISYVESAVPVSDIVKLTYFSGINEILANALQEGRDRIALYVQFPGYNGSDSLLKDAEAIYLSDPLSIPIRPRMNVNTYNGSGSQALFEIRLNYGAEPEKILEMRDSMKEFLASQSFSDFSSDAVKALEICRYLTENCTLSDSTDDGSPYSALLSGAADDEGLALAYMGLCNNEGVECQVVYGQKNREDFCWNIIKLDDDYYHVDITGCMENGIENGFLLSDVNIWGLYRWDTASYNSCSGSLSAYDVEQMY